MPLKDVQARLREVGQIRMGTTNDRGLPQKLETWRLTSQDKELLDSLAEKYGGEVKIWEKKEKSRTYEVITESKVLDVGILPNFLDQWHEDWSGGNLLRRCDGERMRVKDRQPFTDELPMCACKLEEVDAMTDGNEFKKKCRPMSRVKVLMGSSTGMWKLGTTGYHAAAELLGVQELLAGKAALAVLALERREKRDGSTTRVYFVPTIRIKTVLSDVAALISTSLGEQPALPDVPATDEHGEILEKSDYDPFADEWPVFGDRLDAVLKEVGLVDPKLAHEFVNEHKVTKEMLELFKGKTIADLIEFSHEHVEQAK